MPAGEGPAAARAGAEPRRGLNQALLAGRLLIAAMNTVRKIGYQADAGAAAAPAKVVSLVVSDAPGDDPALVASGPLVAGCDTRGDALDIVEPSLAGTPRSS